MYVGVTRIAWTLLCCDVSTLICTIYNPIYSDSGGTVIFNICHRDQDFEVPVSDWTLTSADLKSGILRKTKILQCMSLYRVILVYDLALLFLAF